MNSDDDYEYGEAFFHEYGFYPEDTDEAMRDLYGEGYDIDNLDPLDFIAYNGLTDGERNR